VGRLTTLDEGALAAVWTDAMDETDEMDAMGAGCLLEGAHPIAEATLRLSRDRINKMLLERAAGSGVACILGAKLHAALVCRKPASLRLGRFKPCL
jgi:hypothetical protein